MLPPNLDKNDDRGLAEELDLSSTQETVFSSFAPDPDPASSESLTEIDLSDSVEGSLAESVDVEADDAEVSADEEQADDKPKKKKSSKLLLALGALGITFGGAGGYAYYQQMQMASVKAPVVAKSEPEKMAGPAPSLEAPAPQSQPAMPAPSLEVAPAVPMTVSPTLPNTNDPLGQGQMTATTPVVQPSLPGASVVPPANDPLTSMQPAPVAPVAPVTTPTVAPTVEAPKVEAPTVEAPKVEAPKVEAPKVEAPKAEAPKVEDVKVEQPKKNVQNFEISSEPAPVKKVVVKRKPKPVTKSMPGAEYQNPTKALQAPVQQEKHPSQEMINPKGTESYHGYEKLF